jgi:hypothetical protein
MADTTESPHYQMARENTQSADEEKVRDEKLANETGVEALDGKKYYHRSPSLADDRHRRQHRCMRLEMLVMLSMLIRFPLRP